MKRVCCDRCYKPIDENDHGGAFYYDYETLCFHCWKEQDLRDQRDDFWDKDNEC